MAMMEKKKEERKGEWTNGQVDNINVMYKNCTCKENLFTFDPI